MRTMLVAPGEPSGTPATMIDAVAGLDEALVEGDAAGLAHHRRLVLGVARQHALDAPDERRACAPSPRTGDRPMTGRPGRSRATRSAVEPVAV